MREAQNRLIDAAFFVQFPFVKKSKVINRMKLLEFFLQVPYWSFLNEFKTSKKTKNKKNFSCNFSPKLAGLHFCFSFSLASKNVHFSMCKEEVIMKEKSLKRKHLGRGSPMFGGYQHVFSLGSPFLEGSPSFLEGSPFG